MGEQAKKVAALMGLLSNEHRLLILCSLLDGPKTAGDLGSCVPDISGPALSQHLHRLRDAGLIKSDKKAQFVWYSLADERLRELMDLLKRNYCSDAVE